MGTNLSTEAIVISIYGGTSWTQITDRFLIGASSTYAAKSTGGSSTHSITSSELAAHTHSVGAHSHGLNSHTHSIPALSGTAASAGAHTHGGTYYAESGTLNWIFQGASSSGGSNRTTNVSYSIPSAGSHTHSVTTTASATGGSSGSTANSTAFNSGSTGSGTAMSILNPYYAVYIWVRTA